MEENAEVASVDAEDNNSFLRDEIEALQSIYINETEIEKNVDCTVVSIDLHPATADNLNEQYVKMTLKLSLLEGYPEVIPEINIRNPRGLSDEKLNSIMQDLIKIAESKKGNSMLFEIIEAAKDHLTVENRPCEECAICLYGFQEDDVFTKTECYHYFHSHCLARYVKNAVEGESKCDESDEKNKNTELLCPVCRLPIQFEGSEALYPAPMREDEEIVVPNDLLEMQKKMSEIYLKQVEKGGIIDIEAEKNKFLLEISQVPSVNEDTKLEDDESNSIVTEELKDDNESVPQESIEVSENKVENTLGCVAKTAVNTNAKKRNQKNVNYYDGRSQRYNESRKDKNNFYNTGEYGDNRKNDKYKDSRENGRYVGEERSVMYDNSRRNDRYDRERVNRHNDRSNNQHLGDRRNDRRNDRYYADKINDRYDRRNNRYSDNRRNDRYNDKRNDRYYDRQRNGGFVNDRNNHFGPNRRADNSGNKVKIVDLDNSGNNDADACKEYQNCDDGEKGEKDKINQHEKVEENNDKYDDSRDNHTQSDNERKDERIADKRNFKYGGYRRNERYGGSRFNNYYDNDRRNFRFEGERRTYRKNGGHNESRKNDNFHKKNVKTSEEKGCSNDVSEVKQESNQGEEIGILVDNKKCTPVENAESNNSINRQNDSSNNKQETEVSSQSSNYINRPEKNRSTNRQTHKNNYGKQNYRKDPNNKRFNASRNYRDFSGNQEKHSKFQNNQVTDNSLDFIDVDRNKTVESINSKTSAISNNSHFYSDETKTGNKSNERSEETYHSNRKSSQKFYNDQGMHPRRNSFRSHQEGRSEPADRSHDYKDSQSSKVHSNSNNRHFNASSNSVIAENGNKSGKHPLAKSSDENIFNKNATEKEAEKCKETNSSETVSSEKLSNGSAVEITRELENPVPSSNFLPPMSSIAPPPGFLNPSRKVVYGLAAANPPPGFNRS